MNKYFLMIFAAAVIFTASNSASAQVDFDKAFEPQLSEAEKFDRDWKIGEALQRENDRVKQGMSEPKTNIGDKSVTDRTPKDNTPKDNTPKERTKPDPRDKSRD